MFSYPVVAFIAIWFKQPLLLITYLLSIFFLFAIQKTLNKNWFSATALFIFVGIITYFTQQTYVQYLIYLPPMLILFGLFVLFSQSLLPDHTPLITRYAIMLSETKEVDDRHARYSRTLTIVWSIFFLLMALTSLSLAIFSSLDTWSLFTNIISYILVSAFFVIEFFIRKKLFSDLDSVKGGFFQFIRKIIKIRPSSISKEKK
jgi:uncharacterized membrane protein